MAQDVFDGQLYDLLKTKSLVSFDPWTSSCPMTSLKQLQNVSRKKGETSVWRPFYPLPLCFHVTSLKNFPNTLHHMLNLDTCCQ